MNQELDTTGNLIRTVLYHIKSIEHRITYYQAVEKLKQNNKERIKSALNRVNLAINDIIGIYNNKEAVKLIKENVEGTDIIYSSLLVEQMYGLSTDDLGDITDLIDEYLHKKYNIPVIPIIKSTKFARKCSHCNNGMNEGYVINSGVYHFCSDPCLHTKFTKEQWKEHYSEHEDSYFTNWEHIIDYQYELINNELKEIIN